MTTMTTITNREMDPLVIPTKKLPSILTEREMLDILKRKIRSDFYLIKYSIDPIVEVNGFLGQYYTVSAIVNVHDIITEHKFFAKTLPPPHSPQYDFVVRCNSYNKEVTMYDEVIPRMGMGKGPRWGVECYLGKKNDIIVLDDVGVRGYVMPDKYIPFDYDHCVLVLQTLARFHARSLILDEELRAENNSVFELYGDIFNEALFADDKRSVDGLDSCILGTNTMIDLVDEFDDEEKDVFKKRIGVWCRNISKLLQPSKKYRNVICHRDVWANNFLFKYNSRGKPDGCYIIDFQFVRYSPPAMDFMCTIHFTTDRRTRNEYGEFFARTYHNTFAEALKEEGLRIEKCLPWNTFLQSCEDIRPVALVYAVMNLPIMLLNSEASEKYFSESPELLEKVLYGDRSPLVRHQFTTVQPFRERLREAIMEAKEFVPDLQQDF